MTVVIEIGVKDILKQPLNLKFDKTILETDFGTLILLNFRNYFTTIQGFKRSFHWYLDGKKKRDELPFRVRFSDY